MDIGFDQHWRFLWLAIASLLAGVMNAMAGGGSFLSFPALLGMGVPPVEANATNTVALWPGQLTSLAALHDDVDRNLLPTVLLSSAAGGVLGAETLLHTGQRVFLHLIPWLMLGGALLFGVSEPVSKWLRARAAARRQEAHPPAPIHPLTLAAGLVPICFYVGYFGAGGGFLVMTVLALLGMEGMHRLNAMKIVVATAANLCAIVTFVLSRRVVWHYCLVAMIAAGLGGYLGAHYTRRMNPTVLRVVVVATGVCIAGYFFWRDR